MINKDNLYKYKIKRFIKINKKMIKIKTIF